MEKEKHRIGQDEGGDEKKDKVGADRPNVFGKIDERLANFQTHVRMNSADRDIILLPANE